jgi:hypothetical protein
MQFEPDEKKMHEIRLSSGNSVVVTKKSGLREYPTYNVHDVAGPFLSFIHSDLNDTALVKHLLRQISDLDKKAASLTEELKALKKETKSEAESGRPTKGGLRNGNS